MKFPLQILARIIFLESSFRLGLIFCFLHLCIFTSIYSQENAQTDLIELLAENIKQGDKIALRDLAVLEKKNPTNKRVAQLLEQYTLFTEEEWIWGQASSNYTFKDFFYEKEQNLHFSELLQTFYLTPIEERTTYMVVKRKPSFTINPFFIRKQVSEIESQLEKKQLTALLASLEQLGKIKDNTVDNIFIGLLKNQSIQKLPAKSKEKVLTTILNFLPDSIVFEQMLELTQQKALPFDFCQKKLADVSNNFVEADDYIALVEGYDTLRQSFNNQLTAIKTYGYQKIPFTSLSFFEESVDYFGWMLANCKDSLFWIQRNAVLDMVNTQHPRALFYLAGLQFREWKEQEVNTDFFLSQILENIDVLFPFQEDKRIFLKNSKEALDFLLYWANFYEDYEWDDYQQKFINRQLFADELENYDRHFRRLNSANDSIARLSFIALCNGKPNEIQKLIKKFKPLLRNYNTSLPSLKFKIIERLSILTHFCRQNDIPYQADSILLGHLKKLKGDLSPLRRVQLENQLIETISFEETTCLEYFAALHAQELDLNFSIGRILDYVYSKHWHQIVNHEPYFRSYLFKLQVFDHFGGFGICKKFANKLDLNSPRTLDLLKNLDALETNSFIKEAARYFLEKRQIEAKSELIYKFLEQPRLLNEQDLKSLPPFNQENFPDLLEALFQQEDKKAIQNIGQYMELYASVDIIPQIFDKPQKYWALNKYAGRALIKVLEQVYSYSFSNRQKESISKWWSLWRSNAAEYKRWSQLLFDQQLEKIKSSEFLTIDDLNKLSQSEFYEPKYRILCLESLKKVKKTKTIYRFKISPKLSVKDELSFLEGITFSHKELANLSKLFDVDDPVALLSFVKKSSGDYDIDQKSALYNDLFRQSWFLNYVTNGQISREDKDDIKETLSTYLLENTFLTEFEEKSTDLNILHLENAYLSLKEKLFLITSEAIDESIRLDYLNAILSKIAFHEIIITFPILKDMNIEGKNLFLFLNHDFGLPIFDFQSDAAIDRVFEQLKNHTEYEFYEVQLKQFGVALLTKEGNLDFQQIYQILEYDLVVPFIGDGGKLRDFYTYGVVKLLELHFNTTLGFHEKLNENQTFYTFNALKRVEAWKNYLIEHNLAVTPKNISFNASL